MRAGKHCSSAVAVVQSRTLLRRTIELPDVDERMVLRWIGVERGVDRSNRGGDRNPSSRSEGT
jgi:hypothetical protein